MVNFHACTELASILAPVLVSWSQFNAAAGLPFQYFGGASADVCDTHVCDLHVERVSSASFRAAPLPRISTFVETSTTNIRLCLRENTSLWERAPLAFAIERGTACRFSCFHPTPTLCTGTSSGHHHSSPTLLNSSILCHAHPIYTPSSPPLPQHLLLRPDVLQLLVTP